MKKIKKHKNNERRNKDTFTIRDLIGEEKARKVLETIKK